MSSEKYFLFFMGTIFTLLCFLYVPEGRPMVNLKTIDSVSAQIIPKCKNDKQITPIVLDLDNDMQKKPNTSSESALSCQKCKKDSVMEAVDKRV